MTRHRLITRDLGKSAAPLSKTARFMSVADRQAHSASWRSGNML